MDIGNAAHEFFHVFDKRYQALSTVDDDLCGGAGNSGVGCKASDHLPTDYLKEPYTESAYPCITVDCLAHSPRDPDFNLLEAFANMGQTWILAAANVDFAHYRFIGDPGKTLRGWMDNWMPIFLGRMGVN
jgi:hypothetical protein